MKSKHRKNAMHFLRSHRHSLTRNKEASTVCIDMKFITRHAGNEN